MSKKEIEQEQPEYTPPPVPQYINDAFDAMFEVGDSATMEQRFDALMQAIVTFRFYLLDRHRRTGKKKVSEEELFLFECNEQFKYIERVFAAAKKHGRIANIPNEGFDRQLLAKIVKIKSGVGEIVTTVPVTKKGGAADG